MPKKTTKSSEQKRKSKKARVKSLVTVNALFYLLITLGALFLLGLGSLKLSQNNQTVQVKEVKGVSYSVENEKAFWEGILSESPDYLPGLIEMIKIEEQLGNVNAALSLIDKVKKNHPVNFEVQAVEARLLSTN